MPSGGKRENGGRPKGSRNKTTAEANATLSQLARVYTKEMLEGLVELARTAESGVVRSACMNSVLDRGHGKPAQALEHAGKDGGPIHWTVTWLGDPPDKPE